MKIKKILAAIAASAVAVSAMAVNAFAGQDESTLADGTAFLNLNKADWSTFDAEYTNAEITGDGTYTVSMTAAEAVDLGEFNALEIVNGETVFNRTYTVTIDSVKINGTEKKANEGYTCSADGAGVKTRANIYNAHNDPSEDASADGTVDCRAADGDVMSKSARIVSADDLVGVTSMEVTFTVAGTAAASNTEETTAAETAADNDVETTAATTAAETTAEAADTTAAADSSTDAAKTGNVPVAVMASVMALTGAAVIASRKRK